MKKIKLFTDSSVNPQEKIGFGAYLLLDDENDFILKNLGYLLCQNGEYPNALVVLKDIKHKDFAVLDLIAKCQDLKN